MKIICKPNSLVMVFSEMCSMNEVTKFKVYRKSEMLKIDESHRYMKIQKHLYPNNTLLLNIVFG